MAGQHLRICALFAAANVFVGTILAVAIEAAPPNRATQTDRKMGGFVDSLLDSDVPSTQPPRRQQVQRPRPITRGPSLQGKLIRNPENNGPPYVLVDRYGGVLRYVEPVDRVDLKAYLGKEVRVRHDTGDVLLASQLALPRRPLQATGGVQLAQHNVPTPADEPEKAEKLEPLPPGETAEEGEIIYEGEGPVFYDGEMYYEDDPTMIYEGEGVVMDDGLGFGACPDCGSVVCGSAIGGRGRGCGPGARGTLYIRGEYLLWWMSGMETPPLVIASENNDFDPAEVIYGDEKTLLDSRDGGRFTIGYWEDDLGQWGLEGEFLFLGEENETFLAGNRNGAAPMGDELFIGRPFFNVFPFETIPGDPGSEIPRGRSVEDVDTNALDGTVSVDIHSEFSSWGLRARHNLCCRPTCLVDCGAGVACGAGVYDACAGGVGCGSRIAQLPGPLGRLCRLVRCGTRRVDILFGPRWANLDEHIHITEDLQELDLPNTTFLLRDQFDTSNEFVGGEIGFQIEWEAKRWSLDLLSKVAFGNTRQQVFIFGQTDSTVPGGMSESDRGGLLALSSNDGFRERDQFSVLPEIGLKLGCLVTPRLRLSVGYTLLYWSNVVRPGEQIDLDLNATLIPSQNVPPQPTDPDHPRFDWKQTDLWVQGINFGAEYRW